MYTKTRKCKLCGAIFTDTSSSTKGREYCSDKCLKTAEQIQTYQSHREAREREFARKEMAKIEKGKLDEMLDQAREMGISYGEFKKMKALERAKGKMITETILEKNVDGMWYPYGKYDVTTLRGVRQLASAVAMLADDYKLRISSFEHGEYEFEEIYKA